MDPNDPPVKDDKNPEIQLAISKGVKRWNRSKLCLLGEGRAGKTALANTIIGLDFVQTESTVGINRLTCDVKRLVVGDVAAGTWHEISNPERELENALAALIIESRHNDSNEQKSKNVDSILPHFSQLQITYMTSNLTQGFS